MSAATKPTAPTIITPPPSTLARVYYRLSLEQYYGMINSGIIREGEKVELLDGCLVHKMTQHPPHALSLTLAIEALRPLLPKGWLLRPQLPITLPESAPEPDLAVVTGPARRYETVHPVPEDIALLIEIADSSLEEDRDWKSRIYARARIPIYWLLNLPERQLEVYTRPVAGKSPRYRDRQNFSATETVSFTLGTTTIGPIAIADLLPSVSPS